MSGDSRKPKHRDKGFQDDDEIARTILSYLRDHPGAGDTPEGIARWWMMRQRVSESTETIQQVLTHLKQKGLILERKIPGGTTVYLAFSPKGKKGGDVEK